MAGRAISNEVWQANIIITKTESSVLLIENDRIIPTYEI